MTETHLPNLYFKSVTIETDTGINVESYALDQYRKAGYDAYLTSDIDWYMNSNSIIGNRLHTLSPYPYYEASGRPDLLVFERSGFFFVEVKTNSDTPRVNQWLWYAKYPKVKVIILHITQKDIRKDHQFLGPTYFPKPKRTNLHGSRKRSQKRYRERQKALKSSS